MALKKTGLFVKIDTEAGRKADEFEKWLRLKGFEVVRKEGRSSGRGTPGENTGTAPADMFCVFVLGGDGTFLSAARWVGEQNIPILGIKFGEVGFLADITEDRLFSVAETVLNKPFATDPRMRLSVTVIREGKTIARETVLNDVVINKGALARLAHIETEIDDHYLTTYRADGLIISTPTGSTAYSLAAGGPVIHPSVPGIIMTPICPFTLTNRPLMVPDSVRIKIRLAKKTSDVLLTFDGQIGLDIDDRDVIVIAKGLYPLHIITLPDQHYFDVLKAKLRWSGGRV